MLDPERHERASEILEAALALPEAQRQGFVEEACRGDEELREEVSSLLGYAGERVPTDRVMGAGPAELRDAVVRAMVSADAGPALHSGQRVGAYVLQREIGRGGMGVVWLAHDERLDRRVAMKAMRSGLMGPAEVRRFRREARLLASLSHPHVATVHDLPELDGQPCLIMEYLDGESLAARLLRGTLSVEETLRLGRQVASGLSAAHGRGIVHRDLKPANIQLAASGAAKILDFGVACLAEGAGRPTELAGTVGYMSPEQALGRPIDARSDLFSLGVVLHECLCGSVPCPPTLMESGVIRSDIPPDLSGLPAGTPNGLRTLLARCLAGDVEARIPTASEVEEELADLLRAGEGAAPSLGLLPSERDVFIGRTEELRRLEEHVRGGVRLLTLVGPGGVGKTRLGTRLARNVQVEFPGGTWFCALADARSTDGIASVVAATLGVPLGAPDPLAQLGHVIASRGRCLVVLDNFEQVAHHAHETIGRWLDRARDACFVVTSREPLKLPDEEALRLEPLAIEDDAVQLFEARARAVRRDFRVTDENRDDVNAIVGLVDGLPLSIELAAARTRILSPESLRVRLSDRFRVLAFAGGTSGRHATLRATIDWSWNMLLPWERSALAQASVFEGGFALEAAEAVVDLSAWPDAPWTMDVIQSLVDKSLVRTWMPRGVDVPRFGMYDAIRAHAAEKLREEVDDLVRDVEVRHGAFFGRLGSPEELARLDAAGGRALRAAMELELENLAAACQRATVRGDGETAVATQAAAWAMFGTKGPLGRSVELGERVLTMDSLSPEQSARARRWLGEALRSVGRLHDARRHYEEALAVHEAAGDSLGRGVLLDKLGVLLWNEGRFEEAREKCQEAVQILEACDAPAQESVALINLGVTHRDLGEVEEARHGYERSLARNRGSNRRVESHALSALGILRFVQGDMDEAVHFYERALSIHRELDDLRHEGITLGNLASVHRSQGRTDEARARHEEALRVHRSVGNRRSEAYVRANLGDLHAEAGETEQAREHHELALAILRELGDRRGEAHVLGVLAGSKLGQGRLEEAGELLAEGEALLRETGDPLTLGLLLAHRARHERLRGDLEAARRVLLEMESLLEQSGSGPGSELDTALSAERAACDEAERA